MFGREVRLSIDIIFGGGSPPGKNHMVYNGTSLIRTPLGPFQVSTLLRSPDFRGPGSTVCESPDAGLEDAYHIVHEHTQQAQKYQKQYYDKRFSGGHFSESDKVWLYSPAVPRGQSPKFYQPWKGPYKMVEVIPNVTF